MVSTKGNRNGFCDSNVYALNNVYICVFPLNQVEQKIGIYFLFHSFKVFHFRQISDNYLSIYLLLIFQCRIEKGDREKLFQALEGWEREIEVMNEK